MDFSLTLLEKFALIHFDMDEPIEPDMLASLQPPDPVAIGFADRGLILSGRGPLWLYCFLVHYYHPTAMVAIYDPRLKGAVVVESHTAAWKVGQVIDQVHWEKSRKK